MALTSQITYETRIKGFKDISPESVLSMLHDVRDDIKKLDAGFADADLKRVLAVVETGKYVVNGKVSTHIDLSSAKSVIEAYREHSEGGCQSCKSLGRETIDAQDASSGWYCEVSDPDYNKNAVGDEPGVLYEGFSPKVKKHYHDPCKSWEPTFSQKLEEIIRSNS